MNRMSATTPRPWWALPAAFVATMLALPVNAAIDIPTEPLTTGARVPPNILFVLDNSGSMGFNYMPDAIPKVTTLDISRSTYVRNTIYYDPSKTYQPWVNSDGSEMTDGMNYTSAFSDDNRVAPFATGKVNLSATTQTFYVPKDSSDSSSFTDVTGYWRYQILTSGTVQRSDWDAAPAARVVPSGYPKSNLSGGVNKSMLDVTPGIAIPANAIDLVVIATSAGGADLYLRQGNQPTTGTYTARATGGGGTKTITRATAAEDTWYIGLNGRANSGFSGVDVQVSYRINDDGCGSGSSWTNCTDVTPVFLIDGVPTQRTAAEERTNFATWYSYHRTRIKVAKSGAGRAFSEIGSNYRVGYRNIWNNMANSGTSGGVNWATHPITRSKPIPISRNGGLFDDPNGATGADNNKTAWYERLYSQTGSGSTPLRKALWDSGNYFENDTAADGPWGPGAAKDQYVCRQSFTLLTTDGYRNDDDSNSSTFDYTGVGQQVGEQDNVAGSTITSPTGGSYTYSPARPYSAPQSDTLADIAMYYWKNDLRPDLENKVPVSNADPAFWQHMTTFSISIGAAGTLDPEKDLADLASGAKSWPVSQNLQANSIDDLWHAAVNGRGSFVLADDPEKFVKALRGALAAIIQRTSSYSNVATNSVSLDTGAQVFNATYVSGLWTGTLKSSSVSKAGVGALLWESTIPATRKIFTFDGSAGATFPTTAQLTSLGRTGGSLNFPVSAANNASYIKGDQSREGKDAPKLRERASVLGDIIGSSPAFVDDTKTIYVGANDGMLHAFNSDSGQEVFAYVPNIINFGDLSTLSRGDYLHRYFVDGPIAVSTRKQTPGKNYLVGTLGKGGKGLYGLDVTNPSAFGSSNVLWELAETSGMNMGMVLGKPILAKVKGGATAAVMGNGVKSTGDKAVLLVVNLKTGAVIREIDTGVGDATTPNGLSAVSGVYGPDGETLAYAYAGDLQGNVWKFDLTNASPSAWSVSKLFTATDALNNPQPISGGLTIATHPTTGKRWIFFGTGRFLYVGDADPAKQDVQSMYGFMDEGVAVAKSSLTQRSIVVSGETLNGYDVRGFQSKAPLPTGSKGWYLDLPLPGERIVQDAQVVSTFLITASMLPQGEACQSDGTGFINALDAFTGTSAGGSYFDLDRDGKTDDTVTSNGKPVGSVNVGVGMPTLPNLMRGMVIVGGTAGGTLGSPLTLAPRWDRMSWREIRED